MTLHWETRLRTTYLVDDDGVVYAEIEAAWHIGHYWSAYSPKGFHGPLVGGKWRRNGGVNAARAAVVNALEQSADWQRIQWKVKP